MYNVRQKKLNEKPYLIQSIVTIAFISFCFFPSSASARIIKVGVYENNPKVFTEESGKAAGIFIEIIEAIAEKENWELKYLNGSWAEGLERLEIGEIDLMPDVAYTADRENLFDFHKIPVLSSWFQVCVPKSSPINTILDLNGKRIAVLEGSVQQEAFVHLNNGFGLNTKIISLPDYKSIFGMVSKNEADAAITNRFYGQVHSKEFGLKDTAIIFSPSNLFFAATKGKNQKALEAIDNHLLIMKKDLHSIYYQSIKRWISEEVKFEYPLWLKTVGIIFLIFLCLSVAGSFLLKHQVNIKTQEMQKVNHALRISEKKYRELVMLANSIILRWSFDGRINFLNEFGQTFFGYSEEEILGRHVIGTIVPEYDSLGRKLGPLMEKIIDNPKEFERNINENIRRSGERVWIDWANRIVFDEQKKVKEILSVGSDITDRKKAEEQVRQLNEELKRHADNLEKRVRERTAELTIAKEQAESADRLKSTFLSAMSHELRTPLNSIIGFTGILLQELAGPLNEEQHKQLHMVQGSSRHLLALINDVMDISKIEADQMELSFSTFVLAQSIENMVKLVAPLAEKKGLNLGIDVADEVETVTTDQRRLEQVILNLLNNAVKFTEKGSVHISCRIENNQYLISVTDTGIGIRQEELTGLFQPFHQIDTGLTRKHEGTGLGLSICKKLLNMMGGTIDVESELDRGSIFTIRFPKAPHVGVDHE
ncbi:two component system sensor histidine kinase [Desulfosarcina variabilis str. Montpellier]|uniref:ATP-binding protein n=1 Tax=Desulfosarcina variabilis TaxID=2300 RepID=UPI003AFA32DF